MVKVEGPKGHEPRGERFLQLSNFILRGVKFFEAIQPAERAREFNELVPRDVQHAQTFQVAECVGLSGKVENWHGRKG